MKNKLRLMIFTGIFITCFLVGCVPVATPTRQPTVAVSIPLVVNEQAPTAQPTTQVSIPLVLGGTEATQPNASTPDPLEALKTMTDEEVRAFLDQKLMGHHSVEWVLRKNFTVDEWKQVLAGGEHSDVQWTEIERDFLIDWIIKNHQN